MTRESDVTDDRTHERVQTNNSETDSSPSNKHLDRQRFLNYVTGVKSHRSALLVGLTSSFIILTLPTPVAAQSQVGSGICGTPLANTINQAAPLVVGVLMIGGAILSYILHNASAFPKNPQSVQEIKDWRNRAAFASVTTPMFALMMELFIGFTGVGLAGCIDLVPFF